MFKGANKKHLMVGLVLLALAITGLLTWFSIASREDPRQLSTQTSKKLEEGTCAEAGVRDISDAVRTASDAAEKAALLDNLGACYVQQKNYTKAIEAYEQQASEYSKAGNTQAAEMSRNIVENIKLSQSASISEPSQEEDDEQITY